MDYAIQKLGDLPSVDRLLAEELYRLAMYADLVPLAPGCHELRLYQTKEFLRRDGHVVRILIYFALRGDDTVELQHAEVIEHEMRATKGG